MVDGALLLRDEYAIYMCGVYKNVMHMSKWAAESKALRQEENAKRETQREFAEGALLQYDKHLQYLKGVTTAFGGQQGLDVCTSLSLWLSPPDNAQVNK